MAIRPLAIKHDDFDLTGVVADERGPKRYSTLANSLVEILMSRVAAHPDREAVVEVGGVRWAYAELYDRARRIAGGLSGIGVQPRDRVALALPAGADWVAAFFGILMAGGTVVAINTRLAQGEVEYILRDSGATVVLDDIATVPAGEPYIRLGLRHEDIAVLFYTSGTTGRPKGASTTHGNIVHAVENVIRANELSRTLEQDFRTLISVPLFHVTGCTGQLLTTLSLGGAAVIMPVMRVPELLRTIEDERISWMVSVPAIYGLMLRNDAFVTTDVSSVRWVGYGGAPTSSETVQQIARAFPRAKLSNGYGSTETSSVIVSLADQHARFHPESVGRPVPVAELALDVTGDQQDVGELLVRSPTIVPGYWNQPSATQEAFTDGWFRTGDIVRVTPQGFVQILDRVKDMINRGGENVYCVEVENAIADIPGVAESAVCGVPDDVMGEKVGAIVVGAGLTPRAIVDQLDGKIADYKIPQFVVVTTKPLPRTPAGKVRKADLTRTTTWGAPLR